MNEDQSEQEQKKILKDKNNNIEYIRGKLLGTGGFAKCFEVINQENQQIYAAKVIPKKSINQKRQRFKLLVEIKIHRSLKHKHIVEFIQTFEDRQNVYILLQYCQNYTLKDLVKRRKRITEYQTRIYIQQIVKALVYIHSHSIIHRDLKLGNILINQRMETKICDFGLSTRVKHEGEVKKTICGTPNYIAPEILQENGHSYEVDIWSIGVIMYTLLFGKPPFEDNTVEQTYENIKTNRFSYPSSILTSNSAKDLINRILVTNPAKRISLEQILEHDFLRSKEQIPRELPCYTIAIPPFKIMEIESRQLSQHDTNLQVYEEGPSGQSYQNSSQKQRLQKSIKSQYDSKAKLRLIYIKECFFHDGILGYLLSNGSMGVCFKNSGTNMVLEYGSAYYFEIQKCNDYQPIRKLLPDNSLQGNNVVESRSLERLLNFRKFFITKYGIFKIDELHKKYLNSVIMYGSELNDEDPIIYVKKWMELQKGEILTRMSNSVIQLHFNDLTNLIINQEEAGGIYYLDAKGKLAEVEYNKCTDKETRSKIRLFSSLLDKLYNMGVQSK